MFESDFLGFVKHKNIRTIIMWTKPAIGNEGTNL